MEARQTRIEKPLQWHLERQKGIGSSDVAAILGLNPYKTALDIYEEKTAFQPLILPMTEAMEFGLRLEDVIAEKYSDDTGHKVQRRNQPIVHKKYDFMRVNIDRVILNPGNGKGTGILEIKTTNGFTYKSWGDDGLPLMYYAQLQYQLACAGYTWGDIALLIDGRNFEVLPFARDNEFITLMEAQVEDFWVSHVLAKIPPEPVTGADVQKLFPRAAAGKTIAATDAEWIACQQLTALREQIKKLEAEKNRLEDQIKVAMGDAETLTYAGEPIVTWKTLTSRRIDSKRLQAEQPKIYELYSSETISRRFLPK